MSKHSPGPLDNKYFNFRIFITLDHRKDIKRTEKEIAAAKKELKYWNDFKTKGMSEPLNNNETFDDDNSKLEA